MPTERKTAKPFLLSIKLISKLLTTPMIAIPNVNTPNTLIIFIRFALLSALSLHISTTVLTSTPAAL